MDKITILLLQLTFSQKTIKDGVMIEKWKATSICIS